MAIEPIRSERPREDIPLAGVTAPACKDCAYFRFGVHLNRGLICERIAGPDPVFGEVRYPIPAYRERSRSWFGIDRCGPRGQYFVRRVMSPPPSRPPA